MANFFSQRRPSAFFLLLFAAGLLLARYGWQLGLGTAATPGPGVWPCILGLLLSLCCLCQQAPGAAGSVKAKADSCISRPRLLAALAACGAWLVILPGLGWIVATGAALVIASRGAGNAWRHTFLLMGICLGLGLVSFNWLGVPPLPEGTLWRGLLL